MLLPLLVCATFAGVAVSNRVDAAHASGRAADLVRYASALTTLQSDAQGELLPAVTREVITTPLLRQLAHLGSPVDMTTVPSAAAVAQLRAHTDRDVRQLRSAPAHRKVALAIATTIRQARSGLDTVLGLVSGYHQMASLCTRLGQQAHEAFTMAVSTESSTSVNVALHDVELIGDSNQAGVQEMFGLSALRFPTLANVTPAAGRLQWLQSWGTYSAASAAVLRYAGSATAAQWRAAMNAPAIRSLNAELAAQAGDTPPALDLSAIGKIYGPESPRGRAIARIQRDTLQRAVDAAKSMSAAATDRALLLGLLALLAISLSLLVMVRVRRVIARPLLALAAGADSVSRGSLVDITGSGPREVRTVAGGLSAAVDNLRKIEAQAAAVSAGDLNSDTVREPLPGELGRVMHRSVATIVAAIHERDEARTDLEFQATHDALTRLPNRAQALLSITNALQRARRKGSTTGLMFIDLDFFKAVNDSLGHAAGDTVLQMSAERMTGLLRAGDAVFRLGGDEFVVLLEDAPIDFAYIEFGERLIRALSEPFELEEGVARLGASAGISVSLDASVDAGRLLAEADAAAYSAKRNGRGWVGVYDDTLRAALNHREEVEQALHLALRREEFEMYYQPIVALDTGRPVGFEALIRWHHPEKGLILPDDFIPIAELSPLVKDIGRWTLHAATAQLAQWDAADPRMGRMGVSVNVSGRHLGAADLVDDVRDACTAAAIDPSRVTVEITETVLADDPIALSNLTTLRSMGVRVAIDDFGTGYTSIGQLPRLPVDVLKIDRSFIGPDDPAHQQLVPLIVQAAHAFDLTVVAEGIEHPDRLRELQLLAVDFGQGNLLGHPRPAHEAAQAALGRHVSPNQQALAGETA